VTAEAAARTFRLPDLGEGLADAEIISWLVAEGDVIAVDQPVVEVETAKASVEIPAPHAGTVSRLHARTGQRIRVGEPLISVVGDDPAPADPHAAVGPDRSGNVLIGYGTSAPAPRRARRRADSAVPVPALREPGVVTGEPAEINAATGANPAVISPLVRKLARDHEIDLRALRPTGARATITRHDVEAAITSHTELHSRAPGPGVRRIPLTGVRAVAAARLSQSRREIPEATVWVDVDATEFLAARRQLEVSVLALLCRFCVLGLRRFPELNARIEPDAVAVLDAVHLGVAAQTPRGLVVPVVPDAHHLTTRELATALTELIAAARTGTVSADQLTGGTFTVNNYGPFGVDGSAAIINYPEVAILGIGRIVERPWVIDGALTVRSVTQLTLAFDHRACDGAVAGGFLRFVADCVERPVTALAEL
jgi:pyruvate dehydrogenase E2 component (dihydrolipoamide acetyltransferase)